MLKFFNWRIRLFLEFSIWILSDEDVDVRFGIGILEFFAADDALLPICINIENLKVNKISIHTLLKLLHVLRGPKMDSHQIQLLNPSRVLKKLILSILSLILSRVFVTRAFTSSMHARLQICPTIKSIKRSDH